VLLGHGHSSGGIALLWKSENDVGKSGRLVPLQNGFQVAELRTAQCFEAALQSSEAEAVTQPLCVT
jgi:hypothetical protein